MKVQLVGVQEIHFLNNLGEPINGVNLYCAFKDEKVEGLRTEKFFLKDGIALPKDVKVNDSLEIAFNMKGKVEAVSKG